VSASAWASTSDKPYEPVAGEVAPDIALVRVARLDRDVAMPPEPVSATVREPAAPPRALASAVAPLETIPASAEVAAAVGLDKIALAPPDRTLDMSEEIVAAFGPVAGNGSVATSFLLANVNPGGEIPSASTQLMRTRAAFLKIVPGVCSVPLPFEPPTVVRALTVEEVVTPFDG
jgi:hypothetical protein